ncbi:MAG: hypothetical protein J5984_01005 [Clostridia bacterium]|nr:hypothetical protein [Clostridia bacterium]
MKMNELSLAFTFAGCFLGAGYVSGQEIFQFFGAFGKQGILGLCIAILIMILFGVFLIRLTKATGIKEMDRIVVGDRFPKLNLIVGFIETFFMFGIFVIMTAGASALLDELFGIPLILASAIFCTAILCLSFFGTGGMITVFSAFVPVLSVALVVMCGKELLSGKEVVFVHTNENPLLGGWFVSALIFTAYNIFSSIGIITPIAERIEDKKVVKGVALGGIFLLVIALSVLLLTLMNSGAEKTELPVLTVAESYGKGMKIAFALLLLGAMLGTSLSCTVAVTKFLTLKNEKLSEKMLNGVMCSFALIFSLMGFGNLISVVYPICGYFGAVAIILIFIRYIKKRKS